MNNKNECNKFSLNGDSCIDMWGSLEGSELLLDILEVSRQCNRNNDDICKESTINQLKSEEELFWGCLDSYCGANSDKLVKGRRYFIDKMQKNFKNFK